MTANISDVAFLDVSSDTCPMTFVRTGLMLEHPPEGAYSRVCLGGEVRRDSVPPMAAGQGHVMVRRIVDEDPDILEIMIRRGPKV